MKAPADYVHAKGLKMGIYSCAGSETCREDPEAADISFKMHVHTPHGGIDYLKYDRCSNEGQKAEALTVP